MMTTRTLFSLKDCQGFNIVIGTNEEEGLITYLPYYKYTSYIFGEVKTQSYSSIKNQVVVIGFLHARKDRQLIKHINNHVNFNLI